MFNKHLLNQAKLSSASLFFDYITQEGKRGEEVSIDSIDLCSIDYPGFLDISNATKLKPLLHEALVLSPFFLLFPPHLRLAALSSTWPVGMGSASFLFWLV